jgi:tetratricopeptide (TPR) repeat protein
MTMIAERTNSFGYWVRRRRKALDLTQERLAREVSCSSFMVRKIEADERRPSRYLADRLAVALAVPAAERADFLQAARALRCCDHLALELALPVAAAGESLPRREATAPRFRGGEFSPFVGRREELAMLAGSADALASGRGQVILIEGEPGIGKSRLMREAAAAAAAKGVPTLTAHCFEIERSIPYQPVIELITRTLDRTSPPTLKALPAVSLAELAALAPAVAECFADLPQLSGDFPEARQARLFRAVEQLIDASREGRPLIVMVDDIQWADEASVQVLHYLARNAAEKPVLAIYAYRDEELDTSDRLTRLIDALRRESGAQCLQLARIGVADVADLVAAQRDVTLCVPGLAERLYRETEGNPFFLTSMLHSLREGEIRLDERSSAAADLLPDAMRAALRARLAHVPQDIRPALDAAAVFGRRFEFDLLLDAMHESEDKLLRSLEALVRRRLLREHGESGAFDFSHDKLREVVYQDIGGARRRLLHRSVAEAMERRGDDEGFEQDARLAEHYERAHVWTKALHYLTLAAERSVSIFAMGDALHWFDRAVALAETHGDSVDEATRLALHERRGWARAQAGQTEGAVADIRRCIAAARRNGDRGKARDALIQLGMTYRRADDYEEASACLNEALADSRAMNDERHAADTLYHLGTVAWSSGRNAEAIRCHQEAVDICEHLGLDDIVAVQAFHGRGEAHFANGEPLSAIRSYRRSIELARGIGDRSYESENLMMIGHACTGTKGIADYAAAREHFESALDIARAADLQWHLGPTLLGLDHVLACIGRYGEAWTGMTQTLQWLQSVKHLRYQLIAHDFMGHLLLDLGLWEEAEEYMQRGLELGRRSGIGFWAAGLTAHLAIARLRRGRSGAGEALLPALERSLRAAELYMAARCLEGLAEAALAQGDTARCRDYADRLLAFSRPNGLRELESTACRWRGAAWLAEGAVEAALEDLAAAELIADAVGRVRLQWEISSLSAKANAALQRPDVARQCEARADAMAAKIEASLGSCGLSSNIRRTGC